METRVVEEGGSYVVIALVGALDFDTASQHQQLLQQITGRGVPAVLDVSRLSFMSSMAIGLLMRARQDLAHAGGIVLLAPPPEIEELLRRSRLDRVIPMVQFRHEALRALNVAPQ